MSRDWLALYPRIIRHPKFRKLPESAQLSLVYVWCLATDADPEATWPTLDDLGDALELHGRSSEDLAILVDRGWLDVSDGRVEVHDWDDHQLAASKAIRDAWEASRKRDWRRRKRAEEHPDDARTRPDASGPAEARDTEEDKQTVTVQERTGQDIGPGHVRTLDARSEDPGEPEAADGPSKRNGKGSLGDAIRAVGAEPPFGRRSS